MTLSRPVPETIVRINGAVVPGARVLTVDLSTGGRRLDSATFEFETPGVSRTTSRFFNLDFSAFGQQEIAISVKPIGGAEFPIHWGKSCGFSIRHDASGEVFVVNSRQETHHFGEPLRDMPIRSVTGDIFRADKPLAFNEEIDGQIFPNLCTDTDVAGRWIFADPESLRTTTSKSYFGYDATLWSLQKAAEFLCDWLNFKETYIQNPNAKELSVLPTDNKLIRNHTLRYGMYLPNALDELLEPYGFGWFVKLIEKARRIQFYRRGSGFKRTFLMQPPGQQIDMDKTNVESVNLGFDVTSRAYNAVEVRGDYEQYESTFELMPAWEASYDDRDVGDLDRDAEGWKTDPKLSRVWRDWVLNESADYDREGYPKAALLSPIFGLGKWYPNRRKFLPCIALGDDGAPVGQTGGIIVEWYDQSDSTWKPLDELGPEGRSVRILERECGIRFDGLTPPSIVIDQGAPSLSSGARIRVTATIASDTRLKRSKTAATSLIGDKRELVLESSSRFKYRKIHKDSINYTPVRRGTLKSTEVDDGISAIILCDELIENWNQSSIDGTVTLTGVYFDIQQTLGDPLTEIAGRNIKFATNKAGDKAPTLVGVSFDFASQKTTVTLDTWLREINSM